MAVSPLGKVEEEAIVALGTVVGEAVSAIGSVAGEAIADIGTVTASAIRALIIQVKLFRHVKFMGMLARVWQQIGGWCLEFLQGYYSDAKVPSPCG